MATVDAGTAARELLHVVMLVMRTVAADMRRKPGAVAPAQMGTLMKVSVGPCTMSSLARHQAVSLPTVSKSVDMLVRRGWLERWVDKHDRRQTMVRLMPQGRRVLAASRSAPSSTCAAASRRSRSPSGNSWLWRCASSRACWRSLPARNSSDPVDGRRRWTGAFE